MGAVAAIALFAAMAATKCAMNGAARPIGPAVIDFGHLENKRKG
jgi:hypothetical protein